MFMDILSTLKKALLWDSILSIIVGILMIGFPDKTVNVLAVIVGISFLLFGIVKAVLFLRFNHQVNFASFGQVILSALYIIAGLFILFDIRLASVTLLGLVATIVGITWMFEGFLQLFSLSFYESGKWLIVLKAIINVVGGLVLMFSPITAGIFLWLLVGIFILINGVAKLIHYFVLR